MLENTNFDFLENYNGAKDLPDERDFLLEEIPEKGGSIVLPSKKFLTNVVNYNQGRIGACTLFGSVNAYNETIQYEKISSKRIWEIWNEAKNRGASDTGGWFLQSALQLLKDLGEIKGYVRLDLAGFANIEKIKTALVNGKAVVTGTAFGNWSEILKTHEYRKVNRSSGHIFDIVGYDDEYIFADGTKGGFYVENSWGEKGYFWIKYSDIHLLYSQYIFENIDEIKKKRRSEALQKAFDKKIWNESRPQDLATASEIRIMLNRAIGLPDDYVWLRKMVHHLVNDHIIRGKILQVFEGRYYEKATDFEIAVMFTRAVLRNPKFSELCLSREQVAEILGRDFFVK